MMTQRILSLLNKLILITLTILGFSCTEDQPDEYGMPYADYKINGAVVSEETLERLQNIQVVMQDSEMIDIHADTCYTDANGLYEVKLKNWTSNKTYIFKCIDVDGKVGGFYEPLDSTIRFENAEFENSNGNWDRGEVTKTILVKLAAKED